MAGIVALLGDKLVGKSGDIATGDAVAGKKAVALYFSAHWCPPCRGFTPKFGEWYTKDLKDKGLEVIFISSDRDESAFAEYYGEMPWLAVPYSNRDVKSALDTKFKIQGIPSVVILDPEGQLITKDGREAVSSDPTGEDIPWKPKSFDEIFKDAKLLKPDGGDCLGGSLNGKVFGLYFSAHWCPPCRGFTPQLAEWYKKDLKDKGFEIVFVSSDRDDDSFKQYFAEQPWLALDYADRKRKEQLSNKFGVSGIPSFVIIDKDGSVITKDGRAAVSGDPSGAEFPWYPKPVKNMKAGPGSINEVTTVLAFCESSDDATKKATEEALTPIATKFLEEAKAKGEEEPELAFVIVTDSDRMSGQIRGMLKMPTLPSTETVTLTPQLCIVDIPDNGGYYKGPEGEISAASVDKLVQDYKSKALERQQLE
jgi:nucleoredoxin